MERRLVIKEKKAPVAAEETIQVVTFRVGDEEYGIGISAVAEVVRPLKITPLPRMPEFVEGVINLRGMIIPVVDLRRRFELKETTSGKKTRMMIIKGAFPAGGDRGPSAGLLALVVDGVHEVLDIPKRQVEPAPEAARGPNSDFITGMGKMGGRLIILLDVTRILNREERAALAEADAGTETGVE